MVNAIEIEGLTKGYPDFTLGPLDLTVAPGTVVGIVGANGAGKTTLIKCLLGLVASDAGRMELFGRAIARPEDLSSAIKARIGVVLDTCSFTQESRLADVAQLGRAAYGTWDQSRFDELAQEFGLASTKRVRELSRGMGMKLSLAFALAHDPDLLILDEATAGLDPLARDEVLELLRAFMEDDRHSLLMSSHITSDLEKLSDRILCLDGGRIIFEADKEAILDEAGIVHLREADLERIVADGASDRILRILRRPYSIDGLVADRFAFAKSYPAVPADSPTLDDYLAFMLKGDVL